MLPIIYHRPILATLQRLPLKRQHTFKSLQLLNLILPIFNHTYQAVLSNRYNTLGWD